jgi:hypothetical protein
MKMLDSEKAYLPEMESGGFAGSVFLLGYANRNNGASRLNCFVAGSQLTTV